MYSDLDEFIADLDRARPAGARGRAGQPALEIAAVIDRACKSPGGGPALLFEKPTGFDMPVAANLYGSMERMCLALGVKTLDDLAHEIDALMTPQMPEGIMDALKMLPMVGRLRDLMPKTVKDAPCQEVVQRDGTLDELPILTCWPEDGGPYITFPLVFTKDPESGERNIGTYRMQVFDGRTTGMHWQRHKGGAQHHRVAERLGKRLDVAVALGPEPVLPYCATAPMPEGLDELLLGGLSRAPAHRDRQVRDRRPRGAGQLAHRARRVRRAGRAAPRGAVRRSHRLVFAAGRLPGVPPDVRHAAQASDLPDDDRRRSRRWRTTTSAWRASESSCR